MKTLGYRDRMDPSGRVYIYAGDARPTQKQQGMFLDKFNQTRHERIQAALTELRHVGNINIVYIRGRKYRRILERPGDGPTVSAH